MTAQTPSARALGYADASLLSLVTLVLWVMVAVVSAAGLTLSYGWPKPEAPAAPPVQAEVLKVQLVEEQEALIASPAPENANAPSAPKPLADYNPPAVPALTAVAEASAPVAFALPVEGPVQIVPAREASFARPVEKVEAVPVAAPATREAPQRLTYGEGEGRQPAPEYPRRAMNAGQEGSVVVRFTVGESGRVLVAEPSSSCPWPLLNESAIRAVRERWRFRAGALRYYEVAIHFQLHK